MLRDYTLVVKKIVRKKKDTSWLENLEDVLKGAGIGSIIDNVKKNAHCGNTIKLLPVQWPRGIAYIDTVEGDACKSPRES
jgi:hypothetical protein